MPRMHHTATQVTHACAVPMAVASVNLLHSAHACMHACAVPTAVASITLLVHVCAASVGSLACMCALPLLACTLSSWQGWGWDAVVSVDVACVPLSAVAVGRVSVFFFAPSAGAA